MLYQDIPRIYTAIAEWGSCLVYLYILKKENMKSVHFLAGSLFMLAMQSIFLTLTESNKSPASIAKSNKQWVGTCLYQEWYKPLLISCEAAIRL